MLGDNPEKSKNPLKKAMRRRNAKTVQFTAPTYVEASDVEYSTEEEEEGDGDFFAQEEGRAETQPQEQEVDTNEGAVVEPSNSRENVLDAQRAIDPRVDAPRPTATTDKAQSIDDDIGRIGMLVALNLSSYILTCLDNDASKQSRNGTVRNTDSFFKDDGVETRKINLTPSLLRDDSSSSTVKSVEPREVLITKSVSTLQC